MDLSNSYVVISYLCLVSALILLIFPKINYVIKAILTTLVTIFLGYISNSLFALNMAYLANDKHGIIILISFTYGLVISIFGGLAVLAIFIKKNEKMAQIISRIFKND